MAMKSDDKPDILHRLGRFTWSMIIVEADYDLYAEAMKGIFIIAAEYKYDTDVVFYRGCAPWFDIVPQGHIIPEYACEILTRIDDDEKKEYEFTWHRL